TRPGALFSLGNLRLMQNRLQDAEQSMRAVEAKWRTTRGEEDRDALVAREMLAGIQKELDQTDEAEANFRAVLTIRTRILGTGHCGHAPFRRHTPPECAAGARPVSAGSEARRGGRGGAQRRPGSVWPRRARSGQQDDGLRGAPGEPPGECRPER